VMHRHHIEPDAHFHLNAIAVITDADSLLTALRNANLFEAVVFRSEIVLSRGVALLGRLAIPAHRSRIVLRDAMAVAVPRAY
jgi:hypothetical protein